MKGINFFGINHFFVFFFPSLFSKLSASLNCPPPAGQPPQLLLLGGGSDVLGAPEVVGDVGVGQHCYHQWDQELDEEHHQGNHGPGVARHHQLDMKEAIKELQEKISIGSVI